MLSFLKARVAVFSWILGPFDIAWVNPKSGSGFDTRESDAPLSDNTKLTAISH